MIFLHKWLILVFWINDNARGKEVSYRYNDDLSTCKEIAKENTPVYEPLKYAYNWYVRPQLLWLPDKAPYSYKAMVNKCLTNRGHSIITGE
jgi:hypothetical protein